MMELKKMMGKVIKLTTTEDKKGVSQVMVFTIGANVAPEQFFANMRITPIVKSYEVTNPMPLLDAVEFASIVTRLREKQTTPNNQTTTSNNYKQLTNNIEQEKGSIPL